MPETPTGSATAKIFGVILMALGALNSMLSWRGGIPAGDFALAFLIAGAFVYAVGAIASASSTAATGAPRVGDVAARRTQPVDPPR